MADSTRPLRAFPGIDPRSWEHPADRAALHTLRSIPGFDEVLRKLFGLFGEKPIRLAFQANAVRTSPTQFPRVHRLYQRAADVLDPQAEYAVFVSQSSIVNAAAYGMEKPFIIVNSELVELMDDDELQFVLGHELAHIMSGHVLYTTMMVLLFRLAQAGFPLVGLAARAVLVGLMEWYRKAELSCDRAGTLTVQEPEIGMRAMMKFAGGGQVDETNLGEFIQQAEEYRQGGDLADQIFKVLNLLGADHPFPVLRVGELRDWVESGAYDRIMRGEYTRRTEESQTLREDIAEAGRAYRESAKETLGSAAEAARKVMDSFRAGFNR